MNPFATAAGVYAREECARPLVEDLEAHLLWGWVFSTPEVFLMGRQVRHNWPVEMMMDPTATDPAGDCWHVWLCAGDLRRALELMPYRLPWVSFERGHRLRVLPIRALR